MNDELPRWSEPRKLTDDPHVNLFTTEMATAKGVRRWTFASRRDQPGKNRAVPDAVVMIAVANGRIPKIVLTREYRVPLGVFEISVPSGLVDPGESIADAARREFREETGMALERISLLSPPLASSAGLTDETVSLVYGEAAGEVSRSGQTEHESIEVILADLDHLRRMLAEPGGDVFSSRVYPVLLGFVAAGRIALPFASSAAE